MTRRIMPKLLLVMLCALILSSLAFAFAGSVTVPASRVDEELITITISSLVPDECDSLRGVITKVHICSGGACMATNANELILGTAGIDEIDGKNGMDCIVGGGGNDNLNGGNDDDILIGNDGDDVLEGGPKKDNDICYGGSGANSFIECDLTP
jgi:RTX calcium-binding nonapeptide repeat (4 copies)